MCFLRVLGAVFFAEVLIALCMVERGHVICRQILQEGGLYISLMPLRVSESYEEDDVSMACSHDTF